MRKLIALAVAVSALVVAAPAQTVLYGGPDNGEHPYVAMIRFYDAQGNYLWRCSGSLISPKTVLTAGHCVFGATTARVYFDENPPARPAADTLGIVGTPVPHPEYNDFAGFPNTHDIGVVQLSTAAPVTTFATLPPSTFFVDTLAKHSLFTIVGYGVQDVRPVQVANLQRLKGTVKLINFKSGYSGGWNLHVSSNPGTAHKGGLCFGDSGGPILSGNMILAVNSFVINGNCAGGGYSYRVDLPGVLDWILAQRRF